MPSSRPHCLAAIGLLLALLRPQPITAQTPDRSQPGPETGGVRGRVLDDQDAVLPGVTVTATAADGRPLDTAVTDGAGEFRLAGLPAGHVAVTFQLDGFHDARISTDIQPGHPDRAPILVQRLAIAAVAEHVTVRAESPPPLRPPAPALVPVPTHDETSVCAPNKADTPVPTLGTMRASMADASRNLFAAGDEVVIDGGTLTGLAVGRNYVVRRRYPTELVSRGKVPIMGEHSSGLIQIVSADERLASAVVVYTCDGMMTGDYLAEFDPEPILTPGPYGRPDFAAASRVLFADAGQLVGITRRMMIIEQPHPHRVAPGERMTLFRKSITGQPTILGDAVVVMVRTDTATILVEQARDAIFFGMAGDWAAPQRPVQIGQR